MNIGLLTQPLDPVTASLCLLAGFVYTVVPGPIFFSLLGLISCRGKRAGSRMIIGCLIGDLGWTALALGSFVESTLVGPLPFQILTGICGAYLVYLAWGAFNTGSDLTENSTLNAKRPLRRGIAIGVFNPKSYTVMLSLLAGLVGTRLPAPTLTQALAVFGWTAAGMVITYAWFVWICATAPVKRAFLRYTPVIAKGVGLIFLFFGTSLLVRLIRDLVAAFC